jgi:hypothetical protein
MGAYAYMMATGEGKGGAVTRGWHDNIVATHNVELALPHQSESFI